MHVSSYEISVTIVRDTSIRLDDGAPFFMIWPYSYYAIFYV